MELSPACRPMARDIYKKYQDYKKYSTAFYHKEGKKLCRLPSGKGLDLKGASFCQSDDGMAKLKKQFPGLATPKSRMTVCYLATAKASIEAALTQLVLCESYERSVKAYAQIFMTANAKSNWQNAQNGALHQPCRDEAWDACFPSTKRKCYENAYSACFSRRFPPFFQQFYGQVGAGSQCFRRQPASGGPGGG